MRITILMLGCICLAGCNDKIARQYATELIKVLDVYAKQLDAKLSAETNAYSKEARLWAERAEAQAATDLKLGTAVDAATAATQLLEKRKTGKDVLAAALGNADGKFNDVSRLLTRADDAYLDYLRNLQPVTNGKAQVRALRAALADLAKEPDYAELTAQYTKFALDLEGHLKFHRCTDLTGELTELDKSIANATAAVAAEADLVKKKPLQAALAALNADKDNLTKQRADTGRFLSNACARPQ